jgi:cell pole-organizing protein PopZ
MSDPKTQQEPTMEEILASIRRIISEDDKAAPVAGEDAPAVAAPAPAAAAEEKAPPPPPPPPMPKPAAKPAVAAAPPPPPPPMPKAQPAAAPAPAMRAVEPEPEPAAADPGEPAELDDNVLELTEIIEEGAEAPPAPPPRVERPKPRIVPAPALEPEPEAELVPEPAMMPAPTIGSPSTSAATMRGGMDLSALVSDATAAAAATSFAGFANQVQQTKGVALGGGTRTLEELVKDLLRPMLKDWLDRNLPPLVQRLVEREIAKLAGRAEEK